MDLASEWTECLSASPRTCSMQGRSIKTTHERAVKNACMYNTVDVYQTRHRLCKSSPQPGSRTIGVVKCGDGRDEVPCISVRVWPFHGRNSVVSRGALTSSPYRIPLAIPLIRREFIEIRQKRNGGIMRPDLCRWCDADSLPAAACAASSPGKQMVAADFVFIRSRRLYDFNS